MKLLPASPVEHSLEGRAFVLSGFAVAVLAVVLYGEDYVIPALGFGLTIAGHVVSYRGRNRKRTFWGQVFVASLVFAALSYFLADSVGALFGGVMPQANFAILLVAVTSFDLKTRRNCYSSLWISLAVLYLASVYAWDYPFGILILLWAACLAGFWIASHLRRMGAQFAAPRGALVTFLTGSGLLCILAFILIPQPTFDPTGPLVVSLPSYAQFRGEVENPILPLVQLGGDTSNSVDLHYRGRLGDSVVMYVRTGAPAYWRGLVFDRYDHGVWTASQPNAVLEYPPYVAARLLGPAPANTLGTFVQVFRIARTMPGVINAAAPIQSLYVPVTQLRRDAYGTFHTPDVLRPGTTYSVVSYIPDVSQARLESEEWAFEADPLPEEIAPYLDPLPISEQAVDLTDQIVHGVNTQYEAVMAITNYLQRKFAYTLELGHVPPGRDPVDWFLFDVKKGYCEQFATAATVMLRSLGIPARLVTGYATGDYDPVLDQAVVREKDAHAWVEVWFPRAGWVPFDPTPTFSAFPATQFPSHWAAAGIARLIPHLSIGAAPAVIGSLGFLGVIPPAIAVGLVVTLLWAWLRTRRRRRLAMLASGATQGELGLLRIYEVLQHRAGRRRGPPETPLEYWRDVSALSPMPLLEEVTGAVNEGAYAGRWPDEERVAELERQLTAAGKAPA